MLADEDQSVGQDIQSHGETSARNPHHELVLFEFFATLVVNAHVGILMGRMFEPGDASVVIGQNAEDFVELAVDRVESRIHPIESRVHRIESLLHGEEQFVPRLRHLGAKRFFGFRNSAVAVDEHRQRDDHGERHGHQLGVGQHVVFVF